MRAWLRSQGENVSERGKIPDRHKALYYNAHPGETPAGWVAPLPGPDDDLDAYEDDMGLLEPEPEQAIPGPQRPARTFSAVQAGDEPDDDAGTLRPDPEPAHARKEWRRPGKDTRTPRVTRVTAGIRKDVNAKISFAVTVPGSIWAARDPLCGGVFMEQAPEISDALTDIVCDSPDLIAFFTGPGGAFMRYLSLGAALMPVVQVIMAHHVYHSIDEQPPDMTQPAYQPYAA